MPYALNTLRGVRLARSLAALSIIVVEGDAVLDNLYSLHR